MTIRSSRTYLPLLLVAAAATLAGCGIKNDPVAPSRQAAPATGAAVAGDTTLGRDIGTAGSASTAVRISRIQDNNSIAPAEVSRNAGAPRSRFILDPLLN